jgi:hypothetical protein
MGATVSIRNALCVTAMTFALVAAAHANPARTFVSGLGNDSETSAGCPRTTPCRTFAAAYTVTATGGEIVAVDPSGYGPITITGPVSIVGVEGADLTVTSGTVGITVSAGASDLVVIDAIQINGTGATTTTGIAVTGGRLVLRNSTLKALTTGLSVASSKVNLINVGIIGNTTGISTTGTGVDALNDVFTGGTTEVFLFGGSAINNTTAYSMGDPGVDGGGQNKVTILEFLTSNTSAAFSTFMAGNGTLITGTGPSCSMQCTQFGEFSSNTNPD